MAGEAPGELGDVGGLPAVVELLAHAQAQLVDEGAGVEAVEGQRREHRVHHLGGVEVLLDRLGDAGELDLDGELAAGGVAGPVDLADARRRLWHVLPRGEHALGRAPSSVSITDAASVGDIGAASACRAASACCASSGRPSAMKLTIWPTFISTPFICPSSLATSAAVRMANWASSSARRSAGVMIRFARVVAKRPALRAVSLHIRRRSPTRDGGDLASAASPRPRRPRDRR